MSTSYVKYDFSAPPLRRPSRARRVLAASVVAGVGVAALVYWQRRESYHRGPRTEVKTMKELHTFFAKHPDATAWVVSPTCPHCVDKERELRESTTPCAIVRVDKCDPELLKRFNVEYVPKGITKTDL